MNGSESLNSLPQLTISQVPAFSLKLHTSTVSSSWHSAIRSPDLGSEKGFQQLFCRHRAAKRQGWLTGAASATACQPEARIRFRASTASQTSDRLDRSKDRPYTSCGFRDRKRWEEGTSGVGRGPGFWGQGREQVMGRRGDTNCASRLLEQFVLIHLHSYSIIHD